MPIYEYKCRDCGTQVEKMQKISDAPLTVCENCGGKLEKQISLSGFQFKGAGWYVTDYAAKKGETKSEKSPADGKSGKTEKSENTEKKSSSESTAGGESASNTKSDNSATPAKESVSKKD